MAMAQFLGADRSIDAGHSVKHFWQMVRRRRAVIVSAVSIIAVIGLATAFLWPPVYRSKATILIEEQEIPADLVRSTITSYADQRIETIKQQVMSRASLWRIVEQYGLYQRLRKGSPTEEVLQQFIKDIQIEVINVKVVDKRTQTPTQATIAFTLAYDGETPALAQKVTNELTDLFLGENLKSRERHAQQTTAFLKQEAENLARHIEVLEGKIAVVKQKADGALPELTQLNMQLLNQADRELIDVDRDIRSLEERKRFLEGELATLKPNTPMIAASGERIFDSGERLKALRAQYASASGYLSEDHPDIIKMKQELAALERETGGDAPGEDVPKRLEGERSRLATLMERYGADHPDVTRTQQVVAGLERDLAQMAQRPPRTAQFKPENPAYINIQSQLASTSASLQALQKSKVSLKKRAGEMARRVERLPEVEPEYQDLMRDREGTAHKYQEIRSRLMEAQVSEGLEIQRKGERFSLIDPADLPERTERPNRPVILILTGLLAVAGGVGAGAAAEQLDETIRTPHQLGLAAGTAPLAVIRYLPMEEEVLGVIRRRRYWQWAGAGAVVIAAVVAHYLWLPLDIAWFAALRKLGLS
ncbi:GumC family protein [Nitrospira lenta]|uniref:Putative Lipopolysaccharide biosynthesis protein n=1 Tax=Nitrospira lenta TaxID=1436998 RepID=A0A330KZT1_9BACT|nr:Wzz/FepE/Etk N-terminal domain-containing protein [Nitrospira lenta]SPP62980.1 putative Lipopolysaccharide biosynthesis protein [Nitrospira lenta]